MKCLILAGGSGDRLWPLSRKNYPKQFIKINENRSLLQETIVRNLPFCQEFLIVTNQSYHFIVEGQMKAFQGLSYRCFLEQEPRKTAAAIALACMLENPTELIYVVSADTVIYGAGYQEAVLRGRELAKKGWLMAFGLPVTEPNTNYGYIRHDGEEVLLFSEKPDRNQAVSYMEAGDCLWNSGSFMFQAGAFLQELKKCCPQVYNACRDAVSGIRKSAGAVVTFEKKMLQTIPAVSVEHAVFEQSRQVRVVPAAFGWQDVGRLEDLEDAPIHTKSRNVVEENCRNVTVINQSRDRLVVANGLEDVIVVDTPDVSYVCRKDGNAADVTSHDSNMYMKELMQKHPEMKDYFENNRVHYRPYGKYEILSVSPGYQVKKVTIYPGCAIGFHRHVYRSEHWSIVEGSARVSFLVSDEKTASAESTSKPMNRLGQQVSELEEPAINFSKTDAVGRKTVTHVYSMNESVFVPVGVPHKVSNETDKDVIIIEVGIGQIVEEEDIVRLEPVLSESRNEARLRNKATAESIVKLRPVFKDYIWGGSRLKEQFHKVSDLDQIAESWELSAHEKGQSVVAEGRFAGMLFGEYLQEIGKEAWGWKCQALERFPILVKFLDVREDLSIQVHPDDEYALLNEQEYGKNEMWYILDCEEDAAIYHGFTREVTKEEIRQRIAGGTLTEVLKEVPVKKGDAIFIPAGCVHAVKGGVLLCEIQQNSNSTYRLYDYNREDRYHNRRPLHIEKALDVLNLKPQESTDFCAEEKWEERAGYSRRKIGSCKYFETVCLKTEESAELFTDEASFTSLLVTEGEGTVQVRDTVLSFQKGDSFFIPAGKNTVRIKGKSEFVVTRV